MQDTLPRHTYQIFDKAPGADGADSQPSGLFVLPNVWLGTSVEDDRVLRDRLDAIRPCRPQFDLCRWSRSLALLPRATCEGFIG